MISKNSFVALFIAYINFGNLNQILKWIEESKSGSLSGIWSFYSYTIYIHLLTAQGLRNVRHKKLVWLIYRIWIAALMPPCLSVK